MRIQRSIITGLIIISGLFSSAQTYVTDSIKLGGIYRSYILYVPATYSASSAVPLVFNLHGSGGTSGGQMVYGNFLKIADTANFLVVHPQGTGASSFWNAGLQGSPDDVQFISSLIDSLKAGYNIDLDRVYACGYGNGGIMSFYTACMLHTRIAAIGSVAGTMYGNWFFSCKPSRPFPVIMVNGTADATIPYTGSSLYVNVDSVAKKWVKYNNCGAPAVTNVPDTSSSDASQAVRHVYGGGYDGSSVEFFKIINGSHSWPNGPAYYPQTNYDMDASREIWRFFRQFRLSQFTTKLDVASYGEPQAVKIFPNPAQEWLEVQVGGAFSYAIYAVEGQRVDEGNASARIDIRHLTRGIYFLELQQDGRRHTTRFIRY